MSTNPETTLPVLPKTAEEYVRALRQAFVDGAAWGRDFRPLTGGPDREARRRFPLRRKVPRVVSVPRVAGGTREVKVVDGQFWIREPGRSEWSPQWAVITPDTIRTLSDLLANPYEEIEE